MKYPIKCLLVGMLGLVGCSSQPLQNTYQLRQKASAVIAENSGIFTVWNQAEPPEVGRVYEKVPNPRRGANFTSNSDVFVERIAGLVQAFPDSSSWVYDVTWKPFVKLQLAYMGLEGSIDAKPVNSIKFTATGDSFTRVNRWDGYTLGSVDYPGFNTIINLPTYGPALRQHVYENTQELLTTGKKPDYRNAKYWIVTSVLYAKDVSSSFNSSMNTKIKVGVEDEKAFAAFAGVSGVPTGSLETGENGQRKSSIVVKGKIALTAKVFPLLAKKDPDGTITMYVDQADPIAEIHK